MPLHIAVDIRRIRDFGVGTYIRNLVRQLSVIDAENRYTLIACEPEIPELADLPANMELVVWAPTRRASSEINFPFFIRGLRPDLVHIPISSVPVLMPRPYVVTIHDM